MWAEYAKNGVETDSCHKRIGYQVEQQVRVTGTSSTTRGRSLPASEPLHLEKVVHGLLFLPGADRQCPDPTEPKSRGSIYRILVFVSFFPTVLDRSSVGRRIEVVGERMTRRLLNPAFHHEQSRKLSRAVRVTSRTRVGDGQRVVIERWGEDECLR